MQFIRMRIPSKIKINFSNPAGYTISMHLAQIHHHPPGTITKETRPGKKWLNNVPLCMYEAFAVITFDVGGIFAKIFILILPNRIKGRRRIRMPFASGGKFSRAQNRKENAKLTDIAVIIRSL